MYHLKTVAILQELLRNDSRNKEPKTLTKPPNSPDPHLINNLLDARRTQIHGGPTLQPTEPKGPTADTLGGPVILPRCVRGVLTAQDGLARYQAAGFNAVTDGCDYN